MNILVTKALDEIKGLARFRWTAVAVLWAVCVSGWMAVLAWPDKYESSARIFVDTRTALTPVLQGLAIQQDVSAQLNFVQQSLLGGPQLEKVAREAKLDIRSKTSEDKERVLQKLRANTNVGVEGYSGGGAVYTIRYQDNNRERSLKVVQLFLNDFVEDTLGGKRISSETAQKFLTDQIQDLESRLRQAEQQLADFKKRNVGVMPGEQGDYFSRLQAQMDAKNKAVASLTIAQTRRAELQRQIKGDVLTTPIGEPTTNAAAAVATDTVSRIKDIEAKRDQLLLRYTEKHPDVVALTSTLEELKARRVAELEALRRGDPGAAAASGAIASPVYQSIQLSLNQAEVQIAELRGEIADHERQISELRKVVDTVPQVEAEYARLNRDYSVTKAQYTALVDRLERAKLGNEAEATGSVRFEVVDPPTVSFQPISPKRNLLLPLVLIVGLGAGVGIAYLLHLLKPVFSSSRSIYEVTGLPVLGVVSLTWLEKRKKELISSYVGCGALTLLLLAIFVAVFTSNELASRLVRQLVS